MNSFIFILRMPALFAARRMMTIVASIFFNRFQSGTALPCSQSSKTLRLILVTEQRNPIETPYENSSFRRMLKSGIGTMNCFVGRGIRVSVHRKGCRACSPRGFSPAS